MATSTTTTPLLIGGEERPAADSFPVYDPSNGEVIGHAAAASTADALDAVRAAHEAWPAWAALPTAERVQLALAALAGLESDADERAELLVRENGKTRIEATIDPLVLVGRFHQAAAVAPSLDDESHRGAAVHDDDRPRPGGRRHDHLPVQLAARDSRREPSVTRSWPATPSSSSPRRRRRSRSCGRCATSLSRSRRVF